MMKGKKYTASRPKKRPPNLLENPHKSHVKKPKKNERKSTPKEAGFSLVFLM